MKKRLKINTLKFLCLICPIAGSQMMGCKNKSETYVAQGIEYVNYTRGNSREYDLDSIAYDWASGKIKRFHFLVTENVVDTFTDLNGKKALRIEQFISRDSGRTYRFYQLQSMYTNEYGFQRVEDNQRYVKLAFPVNAKRKWNGNIYNNMGYNEYKVTEFNVGYASSYYVIPNCIVVTELSDSTFISANVKTETFGKGFGLVYKYTKSIEYDSTGQPQGFIVIWTLRKLWL